jgi:hypothetical protein
MCDCHTHGFIVERFEDEEEVYLSLFERSISGRKLSIKERFKWCWKIFYTGQPWTDLIILDKDKQKELANFLNKS